VTALEEYLDRYVALRRALGYHPESDAPLLHGFVRYLDAGGQSTISVGAALAWANQTSGDRQTARRLTVVRGFARYVAGFEPQTQIPPTGLVAAADVRRRPHIFTDPEVTALMTAANRLAPRVWAATMATIIGLMAATGLRPGEVYRLNRADVDLGSARLSVMHSKGGKSRRIPLHVSTVDALGRYARLRDRHWPQTGSTRFFLDAEGHPLTSDTARCFAKLARAVGIGNAHPALRLGDLRHSFAVHTLSSWHETGVDVQRQLPVLSAFLGHNQPAHTYWYLEAVPELMAIAADRLERSWEARS
jgi:integrase